MRRLDHPRTRGTIAFAVIALVASASLTVTGCRSLDVPNVEIEGAVDSTGTVQADLPSDATSTTSPTSSVTATSGAPAAPTLWPTRVGTFAKNFKKPAWYPKYLPKGYKLESVDITEMGTGTGLVCDTVFLSGEKALIFTQGSPKERDYEIVSAGQVPWGAAGDKADIVLQDPEDPSTPPIIVFSKGGTFVEVQGDPSLNELMKIAASMVPVK